MRALCYVNHLIEAQVGFDDWSRAPAIEARREVVARCLDSLRALPDTEVHVCGIEGRSIAPLDIEFPEVREDPGLLTNAALDHMARRLDDGYDYFISIEDDLLLPTKTLENIIKFDQSGLQNEVLLPNRIEWDEAGHPYCPDLGDTPTWTNQRRRYRGREIRVALNPNSGLLILSREKLRYALRHLDGGHRSRVAGQDSASALGYFHSPFSLYRPYGDLTFHTVTRLGCRGGSTATPDVRARVAGVPGARDAIAPDHAYRLGESDPASTPGHATRQTRAATQRLSDLAHGRLIIDSDESRTLGAPYELHNASPQESLSVTDARSLGVGALALRQFGRFGNQVTQLFHAVSVAHYLGASTLYVVDADPFGLKADRYIDRLRFVPDRWQSNHEVVLEGSFYYRSDLGDMVSTDVDERLGLVRAFLDPLFAATLDEVRPSDDTTVHVHFRSGDVFRAAWIHPGYPQPPLSYYQASIERAMAESEVRSVVVVCEDDANPCVAALADWLDGKHIARRMQSASLAEDLAELLSARRLVSSYGSFCDAIALLSRSLQHYTVFRSTRWHPELHAKGVSVTQVMDDGLEPYIRVGAWRASPEQLQTMLTYPHGSLILPPPT